jgi:hypothetical protein
MIKLILLAISSTVYMAACNSNGNGDTANTEESPTLAVATNNMLTDAEKKEGWELLFDGASLKGWHKYGGVPVGSAWTVKDSSIYLDATAKKDWQIANGGDIVTEGEYDNFHLKMDWKIDTGGNSGIIFYIYEDSAKYKWPWYTGMEMQVLDNERHSDAKIIKHRAGDLYDLISSSKETVKPALEWNTAEIKSVNGKLDLYLNGVNIVSTTLWGDDWKKMVAGSKFKSMSDFGTYKKGHIGLQDHGNNVWFKNIKIKKM